VNSLVAFDTNQIKQYVFTTDKLKEIRGASAILDELNRKFMPAIVDGEMIYAHGGSGLFLVEQGRVQPAIEEVQQSYALHTGGAASITGVSCELPDDFDHQHDDIRPLWQKLAFRLKSTKARNALTEAIITHPLLRPCESCGIFPGTEVRDGDIVCSACTHKRDQNTVIREQHQENKPDDFNQIGELSTPKGYFALIYADGDGLGRALSQCKTLTKVQEFAKAVDYSLQEAVREATRHLPPQSYDQLLLGGDDLVMVIQAQSALEVALNIVDQFRAKIQEKLGEPLTLSAAVIWAHTKFPFRALLDIAETSLKFAKKEGARRQHPGLINFLVVSSANHLDFNEYNKQVLKVESEQETLYRTLRPYTTSDLRELLKWRKNNGSAPRSKIEALRHAVFQPSRQQSMIDGLAILFHWRSTEQRMACYRLPPTCKPNAEQSFPWAKAGKEYYTPFADLAELWDFTPAGENLDEN